MQELLFILYIIAQKQAFPRSRDITTLNLQAYPLAKMTNVSINGIQCKT